ncbi:MAG TPA: polysaccharide deacetylase family protein [Vicinamibacterales bacterium]|nr:polysaccharide deacetylase family protein [Vicinamibacterales bacterium]
MWLFTVVSVAVVVLAHTAPTRFILDWLAGDRAVWNMPRDGPPTIYLTYDDGPNPTTTPDLLDVLAREQVRATFFLIDEHITSDSASIVGRMFAEGHSIGLHSASRSYLLMTPRTLARTLTEAADRIEDLTGERPCRAFRPHAGWRGGQMFEGLRQIDYRLVGWGWMLWDFNWLRERTADATLERIIGRASAGDIIVMHDGDESAPLRDQRQTVEATARFIPEARARGLGFGTVCRNGE